MFSGLNIRKEESFVFLTLNPLFSIIFYLTQI